MDIFIYFTLLVCLCVCVWKGEKTNRFIRFVWYRPTVSVCSCMFIYLMCSCLYLHSVGESQSYKKQKSTTFYTCWRYHNVDDPLIVAPLNRPEKDRRGERVSPLLKILHQWVVLSNTRNDTCTQGLCSFSETKFSNEKHWLAAPLKKYASALHCADVKLFTYDVSPRDSGDLVPCATSNHWRGR